MFRLQRIEIELYVTLCLYESIQTEQTGASRLYTPPPPPPHG